MEITVQRESFLKALQVAFGAVQKNQAWPLLNHVLLSIRNQKLFITATDTEIELEGCSDISQLVRDDAITVPARKLLDIVRTLPENTTLTLKTEAKKNRVVLSAGRSQYSLASLPAHEFPKTPEDQFEAHLEITQKELKALLQSTHFAMSQQDVRYYLKGMLFDFTDGLFQVVATDGHRLALTKSAQKFNAATALKVILPRKGVLELLRLLSDSDDLVKIKFGRQHLQMISTDFMLTSKLIDGKFPEVQRVIPKQGDKIALVDRLELKQALIRAAVLCNEKYHGVLLNFSENLLTIHANNPEQEEAKEELVIEYSKTPVEIGFNVNYLLDILNVIPTEQVKFVFSDPHTSVIVEPAVTSESLYVVMPMRV